MELPRVFFFRRGHLHDAPEAPLTGRIAEQHAEKFFGVQAIVLRSPVAATHFNAR
jgi:hypothetical protein